jgi:hypothetical protein
VCCAAENAEVPLRRSEKRPLVALNKAAAARGAERQGSSYAVTEERGSKKLISKVAEPWEKLFILVRH